MSEYTYETINRYNSIISPSTVHIKNTGLAKFFKRYLLQEAQSVFKFTLPKTWAENYFLNVLYVPGFVAVLDVPSFGVIPQHGTLGGFTAQYQPYYINVSNPVLRYYKRLIIGKDCEIIKLSPDYMGLFDIVDYYGDLMALCAETMGGNILNSKLSFIFGAKNKAGAETFKSVFDQIASGEPAAFVDKKLFDEEGNLSYQLFLQNVGQNFIADKLLDTMRNIRNQFLTDIGIPNVNLAKQSGVTESEVAANDLEVKAKVSLWYDSIKEGMQRVKDRYGITDLDIEWRKVEGGANYGGMAVDPGAI